MPLLVLMVSKTCKRTTTPIKHVKLF